jgi:arylsulfatase A-like enzyme
MRTVDILLGGMLMSSGMVSCHDKPEVPDTYNVLFLAVDDMRDWVGFLDGYPGYVHTPNIDRLASEGLAFTNAHAASTVCCPSRNSLWSGKRPSTTGLYNNGQWWKAVYPDMVMMPQYFRQHGYYTAGAGKVFHHTPGNNPPCNWDEYQDQVFDDPFIFANWSPERYFLDYGYRGLIVPYPGWAPLNALDMLENELDWGAIPGKDSGDYGDVAAVNFAAEFLHREHTTPFFLAAGLYRPHLPWYVPQAYFDLYPIEDIVLPPVLEDDLDDLPPSGLRMASQRAGDFERIRASGKWKEAVQAYLASISFADAQLGVILDALRSSPYHDNTIVVLWSDHGWHLGEKGKWHKQTLWEVCTRIPLIIKAPGITHPRSVCDRPVDHMHLYPTLIGLCGLPEKEGLDGYDMGMLLREPDAAWPYPAISEIGRGNMAVRSQNWRYIRYADDSEELYDHRVDPNEWHNLAANGLYQEVIDEHRKWIPKQFTASVTSRSEFYFDPCNYTWLHRETGVFVDGKE